MLPPAARIEAILPQVPAVKVKPARATGVVAGNPRMNTQMATAPTTVIPAMAAPTLKLHQSHVRWGRRG